VAPPRTVAVVTTSRADLSPLLPVLSAIRGHRALALEVLATGAHLTPAGRGSLDHLRAAGFEPAAEIAGSPAHGTRGPASGEDAYAVAAAVAAATQGFAARFARRRPDFLVVLGDRFDMLPAPLAALPFRIPVAHIHGGEITAGAFDDAIRHAVTKLAHLHFVAAGAFADRLERMGEEPWRIVVSGAPGLDALAASPTTAADETRRAAGLPAGARYSLVTLHPETLGDLPPARQVGAFVEAALRIEGWIVITAPNADPGGGEFRARLGELCRRRPETVFLEAAGPSLYPSLMRHAAAVVGNSSSGIIEAGYLHRPVVDIGDRQAGRPRGANVSRANWAADDIAAAWREALGAAAAARAEGAVHPYGAGNAGAKIAATLAGVALDSTLVRKRFDDGAPAAGRPERARCPA
jgi:UDP-hydrolysing UDP-N-acetyl-D-glucosamine 2-epimerase